MNRDRLSEEEAEELEDESFRWSQSLTDKEETYAKGYTEDDYYEVNQHLYKGKSPDETVKGMTVPLREVTDNLDAALDHARQPDSPHITYRGYTPPSEVRKADRVLEWAHANFQVGGVYQDPSYMSVSHCPNVAAGFSKNKWWDSNGSSGVTTHGVVFEIVSSRGAPVAAVSYWGNEERERLMPRGSTFHVVGIQDNVTIGGQNKVVIQMVDVHDVPRF